MKKSVAIIIVRAGNQLYVLLQFRKKLSELYIHIYFYLREYLPLTIFFDYLKHAEKLLLLYSRANNFFQSLTIPIVKIKSISQIS